MAGSSKGGRNIGEMYAYKPTKIREGKEEVEMEMRPRRGEETFGRTGRGADMVFLAVGGFEKNQVGVGAGRARGAHAGAKAPKPFRSW